MLDLPSSQAAGLVSLARAPGPVMISMVSHGDEHTELPLLWRLCASLVDSGYAVTVLDGTQPESAHNPGLSHLLRYGQVHESITSDNPEWNVIAAAQGIYNLCTDDEDPIGNLQQLGRLFPPNAVLVLYGGADSVARLLAGSSMRPLMAVSNEKSALLTSYWALKRLLIKGRLEPTILNMVQEPHHGIAPPFNPVTASLSECARNFLGHETRVMHLDTTTSEMQLGQDVRRLALKLLETAMALETPFPVAQAIVAPSLSFAPTFTRSH